VAAVSFFGFARSRKEASKLRDSASAKGVKRISPSGAAAQPAAQEFSVWQKFGDLPQDYSYIPLVELGLGSDAFHEVCAVIRSAGSRILW